MIILALIYSTKININFLLLYPKSIYGPKIKILHTSKRFNICITKAVLVIQIN